MATFVIESYDIYTKVLHLLAILKYFMFVSYVWWVKWRKLI